MSGLPELNRRRLILTALLIAVVIGGLYFLIPKLAGLNKTWGQLKHGDPVLLGVGAVLELASVGGYALLFRNVFGRGMARIDWRASVQIPLAGIAAIRLLSAAGAGGVAVTVWALRRAGMEAGVIACRMVASYVLQYSIYMASLLVCGLGLRFGLFAGGGSFSLLIIPALFAAIVILVVAAMIFIPSDFERRLGQLARRRGRVGHWPPRPRPWARGCGRRSPCCASGRWRWSGRPPTGGSTSPCSACRFAPSGRWWRWRC